VKQFRKKSARVTQRLLVLIELTKFRIKHGKLNEQDYEQIAARYELSARTLYRWDAAYEQGCVQSLTPREAPGRPASAVRGHTARKIREMRKLYNWGAEVIQAHLKHDHDIELSRHKINRLLLRKGLLFRKKCKARKKHTKVVQVEHPGQHTQIDVKHLPHLLVNGKKCYNYNFIDHASKWSFKRCYDSYGPSETKDFMSAVVLAAPFTIMRSQSDNGIEFTFKYVSHGDDPKLHAFDEFCASHQIRHVLIPPGEKELQGLVERSHRQDDEELFHRIKPYDLAELNKILTQHCDWRNSKRRRKALGWKSSIQFLKEYKIKIEKWLYENEKSPFELAKKSEEENNEISTSVTVKKAA
jgi:transposase